MRSNPTPATADQSEGHHPENDHSTGVHTKVDDSGVDDSGGAYSADDRPAGDYPGGNHSKVDHPAGDHPAGDLSDGGHTAGSPTAGSPTAASPTAGSPTAGSHTAGSHTAGSHTPGGQPARALPGAGFGGRTATRAPVLRLLRAELAWVFKRPRTWIALVLLALVPVIMAIGVEVAGGPRDNNGGSLFGNLVGNGLVLPVVALIITLALLLPLVGAMWSADALAGEASHGTLRGLLLAPVGRVRLLLVKAFGVATAILAACVLIAAVGMVTGLVVIGSQGMVTLSGTTVSTAGAIGRVAIATGWVAVQVWAVAAIALAVSAFTEHPMVVMAATVAGAIVFGVLASIPALSWLQPYLLTTSWTSLTDVLSDPMPTAGLVHGMAMAACYLVIGMSVALARVVTKDG